MSSLNSSRYIGFSQSIKGPNERAPLIYRSTSSQRKISIYNSIDLKIPTLDVIPKEVGISWYSVAFGLANAAIGVGILNYPALYDRLGGIMNATLIQIVSK